MPTLTFITFSLLSVLAIATDELDTWMESFSKQTRCYEELGCFGLNEPWFSWKRPIPCLPQLPEIVDTKFYLMTVDNLDEPELLQTRPVIHLSGSRFQINQPVFYIVHGYFSHYTDQWIISTATELLRLFGGNVILVDWACGATNINYIQAVADTRLVGAEIARLSIELSRRGMASPKETHGIGFSLGAHVLAYVANNNITFHRITALDPAQPGFQDVHPTVRLDSNDADFVDVIHTNGAPFASDLGFGMISSVGHVDFYMNGGESQPGCQRGSGKFDAALMKREIFKRIQKYLSDVEDIHIDSFEEVEEDVGSQTEPPLEPVPIISILKFIGIMDEVMSAVNEYISCSHKKATEYFLESLKHSDCSFWGVSRSLLGDIDDTSNCSLLNCSAMGIRSILYPLKGDFYVPTGKDSPFCKRNPRIENLMKNNLLDYLLMKNVDKCLR